LKKILRSRSSKVKEEDKENLEETKGSKEDSSGKGMPTRSSWKRKQDDINEKGNEGKRNKISKIEVQMETSSNEQLKEDKFKISKENKLEEQEDEEGENEEEGEEDEENEEQNEEPNEEKQKDEKQNSDQEKEDSSDEEGDLPKVAERIGFLRKPVEPPSSESEAEDVEESNPDSKTPPTLQNDGVPMDLSKKPASSPKKKKRSRPKLSMKKKKSYPKKDKTGSQSEYICSICNRDFKSTTKLWWISCCNCGQWFHALCVGVRTKRLARRTDYLCKECLQLLQIPNSFAEDEEDNENGYIGMEDHDDEDSSVHFNSYSERQKRLVAPPRKKLTLSQLVKRASGSKSKKKSEKKKKEKRKRMSKEDFELINLEIPDMPDSEEFQTAKKHLQEHGDRTQMAVF